MNATLIYIESAVAVLRNRENGGIILVECGQQENLDIERLEESSLELAGWLESPEQYNSNAAIDCTCDDEDSEDSHICFTKCSRCAKLIAIIDGGAPEFCSAHTEVEA